MTAIVPPTPPIRSSGVFSLSPRAASRASRSREGHRSRVRARSRPDPRAHGRASAKPMRLRPTSRRCGSASPGGSTSFPSCVSSPPHGISLSKNRSTRRSLVVPAGDVVLKVNAPSHVEADAEADALVRWDGQAVRVVARADEHRAFLIERCRPGTRLWDSAADEPSVVAGSFRELWGEITGQPFRLAAEEALRWAEQVQARYALGGRPFEQSLAVDLAVEVFGSVDAGATALVNQDLHGSNISSAGREPWLRDRPEAARRRARAGRGRPARNGAWNAGARCGAGWTCWRRRGSTVSRLRLGERRTRSPGAGPTVSGADPVGRRRAPDRRGPGPGTPRRSRRGWRSASRRSWRPAGQRGQSLRDKPAGGRDRGPGKAGGCRGAAARSRLGELPMRRARGVRPRRRRHRPGRAPSPRPTRRPGAATSSAKAVRPPSRCAPGRRDRQGDPSAPRERRRTESQPRRSTSQPDAPPPETKRPPSGRWRDRPRRSREAGAAGRPEAAPASTTTRGCRTPRRRPPRRMRERERRPHAHDVPDARRGGGNVGPCSGHRLLDGVVQPPQAGADLREREGLPASGRSRTGCPTARSSTAICWLIADCVYPSLRAARPGSPHPRRRRALRGWRSSIPGQRFSCCSASLGPPAGCSDREWGARGRTAHPLTVGRLLSILFADR